MSIERRNLFYKKLLFKGLLYKLTGENTFQFNTKVFETRLFKQIDGCSMSGPLSVNLSDIHMTRTGNNIVTHMKNRYFAAVLLTILFAGERKTSTILFVRI